MAWPSTPGFVKTNLDLGTDDPSLARVDLYNALTDIEAIIAGRGQASGVAPLDASTKIDRTYLPFANPIPKIVAYQTSGTPTWTVPAGCYRILVECTGGGGGGGYSSTATHGGGGGGGGTAYKSWDVTPGDSVAMVIGAGGAGGAGPSDADGSSGANSTVTINAVSITGNGGGGGGGATHFGGAAGSSSSGDVNIEGGTGQTGAEYIGGAGGSTPRSGSAPGAGAGWGFGGGGYGSGDLGPGSGSTGKDGGVFIWYY